MSNDMIGVPRELLETIKVRADVFDDGSDGADAESARSVSAMVSALLAQRCSCPSGDGSLRWPCPVHPPEVKVIETAAGAWHEGSPPHPWDGEWFLAKMVQGAFVVLRPLPEEYTYDFTTADGTYVMRKSIARWAQLSGSEYIAPASTESRS